VGHVREIPALEGAEPAPLQNLHDAIVNVHDVSYGDKAIEKLKAPVVPDNVDSQKDQVSWWQLTSIQVISELATPRR